MEVYPGLKHLKTIYLSTSKSQNEVGIPNKIWFIQCVKHSGIGETCSRKEPGACEGSCGNGQPNRLPHFMGPSICYEIVPGIIQTANACNGL
jgi:hypothetical protein